MAYPIGRKCPDGLKSKQMGLFHPEKFFHLYVFKLVSNAIQASLNKEDTKY